MAAKGTRRQTRASDHGGGRAWPPTMRAMTSTLVIVRHGESTWNQENLFTGWHDVPLSEKGEREAADAGRTLADEGLWFDVGHTSLLTRAVDTCTLALGTLGQPWLPVQRNWRLNERHYGALQGLDKVATTEKYGPEQTKLWRRSYDVPPPPVDRGHPEHPVNDRRYARLAPDVLPGSECLRDVVARVLPYWHDVVVPELRAGLTVLVVAHGNSLRALAKHLQGISDEAIAEENIATGVPRRYLFDANLAVTHWSDLGDPEAIAAATAAVAAQAGGR
jgi:2,3-bisphosphoglycerate-dependent phosphoglycerate mutase